MRGSRKDLPVAFAAGGATLRAAEWGGMAVELGTFTAGIDAGPYFAGLPEDRCQCRHLGYVVQGQLRLRFADHEEVYGAGDAYYAAPGHTPIFAEGTEYVEFSPKVPYGQTMEVVERNLAADPQD